ncbi:MAG: rhomboid family intramembrane serine protease [Anaerolineales bacterium]
MHAPPDFEPIESQSPPMPFQGAVRVPRHSVTWTYVLIGINAVIFLAGMVLGDFLLNWGALIPGRVIYLGEWWRIITAGFLHAGILHIGFNLYALYFLGQGVERFYGGVRFLAIYAVSMLGGNALAMLFSPLGIPTVGASGAILGLVGALLVYFWQYRDDLSGARHRFRKMLEMALLNVAIGLSPGISLWGHLGGVLAGASMGWALMPRYQFRRESFQLEMGGLQLPQWIAGILVKFFWLGLIALAFWARG